MVFDLPFAKIARRLVRFREVAPNRLFDSYLFCERRAMRNGFHQVVLFARLAWHCGSYLARILPAPQNIVDRFRPHTTTPASNVGDRIDTLVR